MQVHRFKRAWNLCEGHNRDPSCMQTLKQDRVQSPRLLGAKPEQVRRRLFKLDQMPNMLDFSVQRVGGTQFPDRLTEQLTFELVRSAKGDDLAATDNSNMVGERLSLAQIVRTQ